MTRAVHPDEINRSNGSPHPFRGGGLYTGVITSVPSANKVSVRVPGLGIHLSRVVSLGTTKAQGLKKGDSVICAFLGNDNQDMIVVGRMNIAIDVFATVEELSTAVVALNLLITNLTTRVVALETP